MRPIAYVFGAEILCPVCTVVRLYTQDRVSQTALLELALPGGKNARRGITEDTLDQVAGAEGIDRHDELTFDSDDFPKIILPGDEIEHDEVCGLCHRYIEGG